MGLYTRDDSPYIWKKYKLDPLTRKAPRKPASTKIFKDAPTKAQRDQNWRDASGNPVHTQDLLDLRNGKTQLTPITFKDYATQYMRDNTALLRGHKGETSTINTLVEAFGPLLLTDFSIDRVRAWRALKTKSIKASTVNQYASVLTKMLTRAVPTYLEANPLAARKHGSQRNQMERLDEEDFEARAFSDEEFERFIQAIKDHDEILGTPRAEGLALSYCAVETLIRRGSLLTLTWAEDRGTHFALKNTKTSRGRQKAPKMKPITNNMRLHLDSLPRDTPGGLIFPSFYGIKQPGDGTKRADHAAGVRSGDFATHTIRWFRRVCELANVPAGRAVNGMTFHGFRHTGATWYLKRKYSVKAVMQLGGWTNAQLFLDTYVHVSAEEIANMANSLIPVRLRVVQGGKTD